MAGPKVLLCAGDRYPNGRRPHIEIDVDSHKLIEMERRDFSETPNTVLRRLLELGESEEQTNSPPVAEAASMSGAWTGKGVTLPAGTQLRMEYRGQQHFGVIENASWIVDSKKYNSPSAAAGGTARTKAGTRPSLDGWKYWWVKRPSDHGWRFLNALRKSI